MFLGYLYHIIFEIYCGTIKKKIYLPPPSNRTTIRTPKVHRKLYRMVTEKKKNVTGVMLVKFFVQAFNVQTSSGFRRRWGGGVGTPAEFYVKKRTAV